MSTHKSEDYKFSAVKYYLNNDVSLDDVCVLFGVLNNHYIDDIMFRTMFMLVCTTS